MTRKWTPVARTTRASRPTLSACVRQWSRASSPLPTRNPALSSSGSHSHKRRAPPTTSDVKLSSYHCPASASRRGEGHRFLTISPAASGILNSTGDGFEVIECAGLGCAWVEFERPEAGYLKTTPAEAFPPILNLCCTWFRRDPQRFRPLLPCHWCCCSCQCRSPDRRELEPEPGPPGRRGGSGCGCSGCDGYGGCSGDCGGGRGPAAGGGAGWLCAGRQRAPRRCPASSSSTSSPSYRRPTGCGPQLPAHTGASASSTRHSGPSSVSASGSHPRSSLGWNSSCASAAGSCESCVLSSRRRITWAEVAARETEAARIPALEGKKSRPYSSQPVGWKCCAPTWSWCCACWSASGTTGRLLLVLPSALLSLLPLSQSSESPPSSLPEIDSVQIHPAGFSVAFFSDWGGVIFNPAISLRQEGIPGLIIIL